MALHEQATLLNQRAMQQYECSREVLLERDERPVLKPLPMERYEIKQHLMLTVQQNGHVYLFKTKRYFSAPYHYIGLKVQVLLTPALIRIYYQGDCIATLAADKPAKYNTIPEHMPSDHRAVLAGMNQNILKERAASLGAPVRAVIENLLQRSIQPEQGYKSCQGILALAKKPSKEILIESCAIALEYQVCTYRSIERLDGANRSIGTIYGQPSTLRSQIILISGVLLILINNLKYMYKNQHKTIELIRDKRLHGMYDALQGLVQSKKLNTINTDQLLAILLQQGWDDRNNRKSTV